MTRAFFDCGECGIRRGDDHRATCRDQVKRDLERETKTMTKPVFWLSPVNRCDICESLLTQDRPIFDAKTVQGPWGLMCEGCFTLDGVGLGLGKGQKYIFQKDGEHIGRWLKVEG